MIRDPYHLLPDIKGVSVFGRKWKRLCQSCKFDVTSYGVVFECPNCGVVIHDSVDRFKGN